MFMARSCCLRVWGKSVQDHKGEVRKVRKGGSGEREIFFLFFYIFFFWLQPVLEPRYQTTLHETQTRQDSRNASYIK